MEPREGMSRSCILLNTQGERRGAAYYAAQRFTCCHRRKAELQWATRNRRPQLRRRPLAVTLRRARLPVDARRPSLHAHAALNRAASSLTAPTPERRRSVPIL
ncbi:hypothetical protein MTO96_025374 [Rhipicephalus appendiculatus]